MAVGVTYEIPVDLIEKIAERAVELLADRDGDDNPWLDVEEAAHYLRCPRSRIYALSSAEAIPHHHDGTRLLFRRGELDEWIEHGGGRRS